MGEQAIKIKDIELVFFKSKKAKSINVSIKPFKGVRVSVPSNISFSKAKNAVEKKIDWIKKNIIKIKKAESLFTFFDFDSEFKTREHYLKLKRGDFTTLKSNIRGENINVLIPENLKITDDNVQLEIRNAIERAWRKEAKSFLPKRVKYLASKNNFEYNKVKIQNSKTRWGSCSFDNNINLSLHLMRLPDNLIDYVILHELTHTKIKHHSNSFWQLLDRVSGDAKGLDRQVKMHRTEIY